MSKKNGLMAWFKRNILRMGTDEPTVDISEQKIESVHNVVEIEQELEKKREEKEIEEKLPIKLKTIKLVNNLLTVVTQTGEVYSKTNATEEDYKRVEAATSNEEIAAVFITEEKVSEIKMEKVKREEIKKKEVQDVMFSRSFEELSSYNDMFIINDNTVYLNREGLKHRSIPKLLVEKFSVLIMNMKKISDPKVIAEYEKAIATLVRFWEKCCLCPNPQSAEDLYAFLEKHKMKIDQHGNFYAYRRVVRVKDDKVTKFDKDLVDYISNAYNKVKAVWKKKPVNFDVYKKGDDFSIVDLKKVKGEIKATKIGNLEELYTKSLVTMPGNRFTDKHTNKEDYRVGEIISMPRQKADSSNSVSCSTGYHVANPHYDYSGFGDTPILAIVNPIDVVAVPKGEEGKMRVARWFFAMTLDPREEHILDDSRFDVKHLGDVFEDKCLKDLSSHITKIFAEEITRHKVVMTKEQLSAAVKSLQDIKDDLRKRIQKAV